MAKNKKFPTLAFVVLILAIFWLLKDLNLISIDLPWIPVILIVISIGWIINSLSE